MEALIGIFFGWCLGILGGPLADYLISIRRRNKFLIGVKTEFRDVEMRLAGTIYEILSSLGKMDRDKVQWIKRHINAHNETIIPSQINEALDKYAALTPNQFASINDQLVATYSKQAKAIPHVFLYYLDSDMITFSLLSEQQQVLLVSIKRHLAVINEKIDSSNTWTMMTFETTNPTNYDSAAHNYNMCLQALLTAATQACDDIERFCKL